MSLLIEQGCHHSLLGTFLNGSDFLWKVQWFVWRLTDVSYSQPVAMLLKLFFYLAGFSPRDSAGSPRFAPCRHPSMWQTYYLWEKNWQQGRTQIRHELWSLITAASLKLRLCFSFWSHLHSLISLQLSDKSFIRLHFKHTSETEEDNLSVKPSIRLVSVTQSSN